MSRNKMRNQEGKLNHASYTIESGHGGLKRNMMGAGASIRPKDAEDGGINAKAQLAAQAGARAPADDSGQLAVDASMPEDGSGAAITSVGESAGSAVGEYKKRQAASKKKSSGGGRGYGA